MAVENPNLGDFMKYLLKFDVRVLLATACKIRIHFMF